MTRFAIDDGESQSGDTGSPGPFIDSNENLYAVLEDGAVASDLSVYKSTDGGQNWTKMDDVNQPTITNTLGFWGGVVDGTVLHIASGSGRYVSGMTDFHDIEYHTFNLSDAASNPDTWQIVNEAITSPTSESGFSFDGSVDIAVRSDGDIIVTCQVDIKIMGNDLYGAAYSRREATVWTTEVGLYDTGEETFTGTPAIVMAPGDECHMAFWNNPVTGLNPPYFITLDSANALSTRFAAMSDNRQPVQITTVDEGGTEKIIVASSILEVQRFEEDGSGDISVEAGQTEVATTPVSGGGVATASDDEVYRVGENAGVELSYVHSTFGADDDWSGATEMDDELVVTGQEWPAIYFRDGSERLGVIYGNTTDAWFVEVIIPAPVAAADPPLRRRQLTTVRM